MSAPSKTHGRRARPLCMAFAWIIASLLAAPWPAAAQAAPATAAESAPSAPGSAAPVSVPAAGKASAAGPAAISFSKDTLHFGRQVVQSTSAGQSLIVRAASAPASAASSAWQLRASGAFTVSPERCELLPGGSCAASVTFAPIQPGSTDGAIVIADAKGGPTWVAVTLSGQGISLCESRGTFGCSGWSAQLPVLLLVLIYLAAMLAVRWHMVARPARELLKAEIEAVAVRLDAHDPHDATTAKINRLLECARSRAGLGRGLQTALDILFWSRGREMAGWNLVHEAKEQLVAQLSVEELRAAIEDAEVQLRQVGTPDAVALADRIDTNMTPTLAAADAAGAAALHGVEALVQRVDASPAAGAAQVGNAATVGAAQPPVERWRAQLQEARNLLYDHTDNGFCALVSWHKKTVWMVLCALLLIVSLSAALGQAVLFLLGATGGLLSRLNRSLTRQDLPTDYGATWTTLFLSPVVGALAGWSGVLLVMLAVKMQLLGPLFASLQWNQPLGELALGLALVFGVSERAFTSILDQIERKIGPAPTVTAPPADAPLAIATGPELTAAAANKEYKLQLTATGGKPPYQWSTSGDVPKGLKLDAASGLLQGTATSAGPASFKVTVKDAAGKTASKDMSLKVGP